MCVFFGLGFRAVGVWAFRIGLMGIWDGPFGHMGWAFWAFRIGLMGNWSGPFGHLSLAFWAIGVTVFGVLGIDR